MFSVIVLGVSQPPVWAVWVSLAIALLCWIGPVGKRLLAALALAGLVLVPTLVFAEGWFLPTVQVPGFENCPWWSVIIWVC